MKPLTKSQFKLGLDCLQKLRHYRDGLPSTLEDNSLLRLLAEGGGAVEALQRAVEPPAWVGADGGADVAPASRASAHAQPAARTPPPPPPAKVPGSRVPATPAQPDPAGRPRSTRDAFLDALRPKKLKQKARIFRIL